jgi:hypothetical protein
MLINDVKYIDSTYKYEASVVPGSEKYFEKLHVQNQFWPFGLTKSYQYEYTSGFAGLNSQTKAS